MDGDSTQTSCHMGEQFCDVCHRQGRKRIQVQIRKEEGQVKRVRLQDVTTTGHCRKAEQQALQMAEEREQEDAEREQGIQQQKREAREQEEARTAWIQEQRERSMMQVWQQHRNVEHASMSERLVDLFER